MCIGRTGWVGKGGTILVGKGKENKSMVILQFAIKLYLEERELKEEVVD
jgi:hypothetical protein